MNIGHGIQFEKGPTLKDLSMALVQLCEEGHGLERVELSSDEEGNQFMPLSVLEHSMTGTFTLYPAHT
jgi:hypothetical protein